MRKDLLYRLNVATLDIPPIKKRREDIPLLIDYFIREKEKNNLNKIKLAEDVYPLLQTVIGLAMLLKLKISLSGYIYL